MSESKTDPKTEVRFAADTGFYVVEGKPVTIEAGEHVTPFYCACWDSDPPRSFSFNAAIRKGEPISEAEFRKFAKLYLPPSLDQSAS